MKNSYTLSICHGGKSQESIRALGDMKEIIIFWFGGQKQKGNMRMCVGMGEREQNICYQCWKFSK